jgi:hypothetical protein
VLISVIFTDSDINLNLNADILPWRSNKGLLCNRKSIICVRRVNLSRLQLCSFMPRSTCSRLYDKTVVSKVHGDK